MRGIINLEGKGVYTILLAANAILALALAVLVIFLFVTWGPNNGTTITENPTMKDERLVPMDESKEFDIFPGQDTSAPFFTLKPEPEHPDSILMLTMKIKCDMGKKSKNEEEITSLVTQTYAAELQQAVTDYISKLTYSDVILEETKYKTRDDLKSIFNEILNSGRKEKEPIVYSVTTPKWFIQ